MKKTKKTAENEKKERKSRFIKRAALEMGDYDCTDPESSSSGGTLQRAIAWFREAAAAAWAGAHRDPAHTAVALVRGLAFGITAFLLGRTPLMLDTYPLAIALLCAAEKNIIYIFTGAVISAFTVSGQAGGVIFSPVIYVSAYLMIIAIRCLARVFIDPPGGFSIRDMLDFRREHNGRQQLKLLISSRFGENIYLRMASGCVAAFFVSLYAIGVGAYRFYDLFSAMFAMVSAPAVTFVFSGLYANGEEKNDRIYHGASVVALIASLVFSLRSTYILGINISVFGAFCAVFYMARKKSVLYASVMGLAVGVAVSPIYTPAFVLAAIASGATGGSAILSSAAAAGVALLWGIYIDGTAALVTLMPALLSAAVFSSTFEKLSFLPITVLDSLDKTVTTKGQEVDAKERFEMLAGTFGQLSAALYDISDRLTSPGPAQARSICLRAFEGRCVCCEKNDTCRREYAECADMVTKLGEVLISDGRIRIERLPKYISESCVRLEDVVLEVNTLYAELIRERITGEKTELFALDYDAVSHIIAEAIEENDKENRLDEELSGRLRRICGAELGVKEISVRGERKKRIFAGNIGRRAEEMGVDELREKLEAACGFALTNPVFELREGKVSLRAEAMPRFDAVYGRAVRSRSGETVCGDSTRVFKTAAQSFYAMISDGMGSGQSAAMTSEICSVFLYNMLLGGNRKETSMKMLNTLLRSKGEESSATVDLMELDLINGNASFIKSGASPSFVKRGDKLYKLRSNTAPIGIMRNIDAEQIRFELEAEDIIIMLSDGISQAPDESLWLMELLSEKWEEEAELDKIAERICQRSAEEGEEDDASILLIKIKAA
ncbi:MAG: SpoIIE family protein phosphatase [Clostridia bacterium]|nr:SpoIIE family protein phosphatase [Clostridia bacterium]